MPDDMWKMIMERRMEIIEARMGVIEGGATRAGIKVPEPTMDEVADATELDGPYGNPLVRKDPPRWKGPTHVGMSFSSCEPEYLMELAGFFTWQARKDQEVDHRSASGRPTAPYKLKDAARARGWAARNRVMRATAAKRPPEPAPSLEVPPLPDFDIDDDGGNPF